MTQPAGFSTVTPYLFVDGAAGYIEFLKAAFDAEELGRHLGPGKRIANAILRIGTASFMLSDCTEAFPAMPSAYYLYVEDAHTAMARALEAGAIQVMEVGDMPYGDRQGGVRDPFGNLWWISQRLVDTPYY